MLVEIRNKLGLKAMILYLISYNNKFSTNIKIIITTQSNWYISKINTGRFTIMGYFSSFVNYYEKLDKADLRQNKPFLKI